MPTLTAGRDIVLVRHGETDWNREKRIQGSLGASINDAGREQAKGLARLLWEVPLQAVYSSALPRAIETASYVQSAVRLLTPAIICSAVNVGPDGNSLGVSCLVARTFT